MSEAKSTKLRIYCLCGQKMKVTSNMLGKPGKCVACRQKIRIPSKDEIPEGSTVIHLKDHPEFLRQPKRDVAPEVEPHADAAGESEIEVVLEGEKDAGELAAIPFVLYPPLGQLCNYEYAIQEQLQALRENRKAEFDKATLMGYRGLARKARQHLEKRIRDELIESGAELQRLQDGLATALLGLRTGDLPYIEYSKRVLPQRKRRELLTYRQHNLRGWLATEDPHMAGTLVTVDLTDVPVEPVDEPFPLDNDIDGLPIENAVRKLEETLRQREKADKRLNELHRMNLDGALSAEALRPLRADTEAARERARTGVAFYRSRLQQVIQDCEDDSEALKAHQQVKKQELEAAAIAKDTFDALEEASFRAQVDIKRARNMATRALNANAVSDVPNPRGTFLDRLAQPGDTRGIGIDSWLAWVGSAMMLAVIFVPIADHVPGGNAAVFQGFILGLFAGSAVLGLCATLSARLPRAIAINTIWLAMTLAGAAYFHLAVSSDSLAGATLRAGDPWWTSLGGMLLIAGWAVAALAAITASITVPPIRWLGAITVAAGALTSAALLTGLAGLSQPEPVIATITTQADAQSGAYSVVIPLRNTGARPFWLGGDPVKLPASTRFLVERRIGPSSWENINTPLEATIDGASVVFDLLRGLPLSAGAVASIRYHWLPGTYRVQIIPQWPGGDTVQQTVQLEPFQIDMDAFFTPAPDAGAGTTGESRQPDNEKTATVELRGVVDGKDSQPKFSIIVRQPDGTETREQFGLGDKLWGEWTISEFSPAQGTITVSDGERLVIVERGAPEALR